MSLLKTLLLILLLVQTYSSSLFAQAETDSLNEVKYGFLPVVSFNSDRKFIGGLEIQEFDYTGSDLPFKSYSRARISYASIGAFTVNYFRDQVKTFGTDTRSSFSVFMSQNYGNYYPGLTVNEPFNKALFDTTAYYSYNSFSFNAIVNTRWPFYLGEFIERSDTKIGLQYVYENPFGYEQDSYLNTKRPTGFKKSSLFIADIGIIIERRNSEFQAQKGYFASANLRYSLPYLSTEQFGLIDIEGRHFLPLIASQNLNFTWANRVNWSHAMGETPFWLLPNIGGFNLRGYIWRRAVGIGSFNYSTELRSWFIHLPYKNIKAGLNVFVDGGTVYGETVNFLKPHYFTFGFGGVFSIFTPDYILKYDIGFSREGLGIYLGTGYSF